MRLSGEGTQLSIWDKEVLKKHYCSLSDHVITKPYYVPGTVLALQLRVNKKDKTPVQGAQILVGETDSNKISYSKCRLYLTLVNAQEKK